ncbi:restriction endonuclease subunit S [Treponema sp.]|uniref:restriction endonuclease subunit S n=1 Tax=Treponema sp. TaxID=166 RepID=UPI003FD80451
MNDKWEKVSLGDLMSFKNGLNFSQNPNGKEYNFLGVGSFKMKNSIKSILELEKVLIVEGFDKEYLLKKNDLVFVRSNGSKDLVGRCVLIEDELPNTTYSGFCIKGSLNSEKTTSEYILKNIEAGFLKEKLKRENRGTNISNLNQEILNSLEIRLPPLVEQKNISEVLSIWDSVIEKTEKLIVEKEKIYNGFTSKLFKPKDNLIKISDFAVELSSRNKQSLVTQVLSVTNKNGFVLPEEQFGKKIASDDLSNYKIVEKGQFAYNPSRINVGSIARLNDFDEAVLSPMYTIFKIDEETINSDYFLHWLSSKYAIHQIKQSAQGGVRETVSFEDFKKMKIDVPVIEKQEKIASFLNSLQKEIALLKQQLEQYKLQKQGLMKKLLTGEWRVK